MADNGAGSGHNGVLHLGEEGSVNIEVPCVSLAEAFATAGDRIDLLKMDAEGAEYDIVLNSAPETWSGVRRVVMEYHPLPEHTFEELQSHLEAVGLDAVAARRGVQRI